AALAQLFVGGPVGLVESAAGGGDSPGPVLRRHVGAFPEGLLGGRGGFGEGAGLAVDQLAVDHHLRLEADLYSVSHVCCAFVVGTQSRAPGRTILWEALPQDSRLATLGRSSTHPRCCLPNICSTVE